MRFCTSEPSTRVSSRRSAPEAPAGVEEDAPLATELARANAVELGEDAAVGVAAGVAINRPPEGHDGDAEKLRGLVEPEPRRRRAIGFGARGPSSERREARAALSGRRKRGSGGEREAPRTLVARARLGRVQRRDGYCARYGFVSSFSVRDTIDVMSHGERATLRERSTSDGNVGRASQDGSRVLAPLPRGEPWDERRAA